MSECFQLHLADENLSELRLLMLEFLESLGYLSLWVELSLRQAWEKSVK
jgi:hypothetical protein